MKHEELMHFFDVLTTLRDEYAKSNDTFKVVKIATLAQVAVEIIKQGKIPDSFQLERNSSTDPALVVTPVEELFRRLSINVELCAQGSQVIAGRNCYMVFNTSDQ